MFKLVEYNSLTASAAFLGSDGRYYTASGPSFILNPSTLSPEAIKKAKTLATEKNVAFGHETSASQFIKASQKVVDLNRSYQLINSLPEPLPHIDNPSSARAKIHRRLEETLRAGELSPAFMNQLLAFDAAFGLSTASKQLIKRAEPDFKFRSKEQDHSGKSWDDIAEDYLGMVHSLLIRQGKMKEAKFALLQLRKNLSPQGEKTFANAIEKLYGQTHPNPHRDRDEDIKPWQKGVSSKPNPFQGQKKKWL